MVTQLHLEYYSTLLNFAASYNAKIEASGGNASAGSGSLNVDVVNANGLTIKNQVVWNQGNIQFQVLTHQTMLYNVMDLVTSLLEQLQQT